MTNREQITQMIAKHLDEHMDNYVAWVDEAVAHRIEECAEQILEELEIPQHAEEGMWFNIVCDLVGRGMSIDDSNLEEEIRIRLWEKKGEGA